jgi:arylsulfatase
MTRILPKIACVFGAVACLWFGGCSVGPAVPRPHVVLITLDTVSARHLGCYGYARDTSPVLDAVAKKGVLFERCWSASNVTNPGHTSILTGQYVQNHGVYANTVGPSADAAMLAEYLKEHGYKTAAFTSAFILNAGYGFGQGFDHFDTVPGEKVERKADETNAKVFVWLDENAPRPSSRSAPLFLWVHYYDPHQPYVPPPEYATKYFAEGLSQRYDTIRHQQVRNVPPKVRDVEFLTSQYDGEIAFMDRELGKLLGRLDAALGEDVLYVITADHGEMTNEREDLSFGHDEMFEPVLHIPLVLKHPSFTPARIKAWVQNVDIFPTIARFLGDDPPTSVEGTDLLPLIAGEKESVRDAVFAESYLNTGKAIRTDQWKYIYRWVHPQKVKRDDSPECVDVDPYPPDGARQTFEDARGVFEHRWSPPAGREPASYRVDRDVEGYVSLSIATNEPRTAPVYCNGSLWNSAASQQWINWRVVGLDPEGKETWRSRWYHFRLVPTQDFRELFDLTSDPLEMKSLYHEKKDVADELEARLLAHSKPVNAVPTSRMSVDAAEKLKGIGYAR